MKEHLLGFVLNTLDEANFRQAMKKQWPVASG